MKAFMDRDFLLSTGVARALYHEAAADMPIFDYHCHLNPQEIYENIRFRNLGHLMLGGDHYKWRAMLSAGVPEENIRGEGSDWDKFYAFAGVLKYAIGNPLYHWTHLELQRVFGIRDVLDEASARAIYDSANAMLATEDFRCRRLIEKMNVRLVCTTDDPCDDLRYHKLLAQEKEIDQSFAVKVLPTFRPDKALHIDREGFAEYIGRLGEVSGEDTGALAGVTRALWKRVEYFHAAGARISDHGMDKVAFAEPDEAGAALTLRKALAGQMVSVQEAANYKTVLHLALGRMYHARGWVMQCHIGAMRNNNRRMFRRYGPDVGFDSVWDGEIAENLSRLLGGLDATEQLPKTILYCLNPKDNYVLGTMLGNFQGGVPGKIQFGSGWWFNDQRDGMLEQMKALANLGLLGHFVGMLTDSRSFISYPRHEYFRRVLCDMIGGWVENGEYPADMDTLKELVRGICYENAVRYFGIEVKSE